MLWIGLAIAALGFVEILLRSGLFDVARMSGDAAVKASRVIRSARISDHWKEKALKAYASTIFKNSLWLFGVILVAILPAAVVALASRWQGYDFVGFAGSWQGLLIATVIGIGYGYMRTTNKSPN